MALLLLKLLHVTVELVMLHFLHLCLPLLAISLSRPLHLLHQLLKSLHLLGASKSHLAPVELRVVELLKQRQVVCGGVKVSHLLDLLLGHLTVSLVLLLLLLLLLVLMVRGGLALVLVKQVEVGVVLSLLHRVKLCPTCRCVALLPLLVVTLLLL